jgi:hypothetical protein
MLKRINNSKVLLNLGLDNYLLGLVVIYMLEVCYIILYYLF